MCIASRGVRSSSSTGRPRRCSLRGGSVRGGSSTVGTSERRKGDWGDDVRHVGGF